MADPLVAIHSVPRWLPLTQGWIALQVTALDPHVENHVVCEEKLAETRYERPNVHDFRAASLHRVVIDSALRKLGIRRHLGFLAAKARETGASVIHSHFGNRGYMDHGAARRAGTAHVVTFYGYDVGRLPVEDPRWHRRYAALFRGVDAVLCEGPAMARSIVALGCPEDRVRVHHLGLEPDLYRFEPRRWSPGEPLRVLIAAGFVEKKGIPLAIRALSAIRKDAPVSVTLIGDDTGAPGSAREKQKILDAIDEEGLGDAVRMTGFVDHDRLMEESYAHHVFLSPSITAKSGDTEGGAPFSIVQMMATGMIFVGSTHADLPELAIDGESGLLAPEGDVDGLVASLRNLIGHPDDWGRMAAAARKRVEDEFDANVQGKRLAAIYRELAETRSRSISST